MCKHKNELQQLIQLLQPLRYNIVSMWFTSLRQDSQRQTELWCCPDRHSWCTDTDGRQYHLPQTGRDIGFHIQVYPDGTSIGFKTRNILAGNRASRRMKTQSTGYSPPDVTRDSVFLSPLISFGTSQITSTLFLKDVSYLYRGKDAQNYMKRTCRAHSAGSIKEDM